MLTGFRKKFFIATIAVLVALVAVSLVIVYVMTIQHSTAILDRANDLIYENRGELPSEDRMIEEQSHPLAPLFAEEALREVPYTTRYFSVCYDLSGEVPQVNLEHIATIDESQALSYAQKVAASGNERGWEDGFRYLSFKAHGLSGVLFIDGRGEMDNAVTSAIGLSIVILLFAVATFILVVVLTRWAAKPIRQAYIRQTRFVANASHELKTPLTLILTDADLIEMDHGPSEEIDDIRSEVRDMGDLLTQMMSLAYIDEEACVLNKEKVDVSFAAESAVKKWRGKAQMRGLFIDGVIQKNVVCSSDEASIKQIILILMDNATKYCDEHGTIHVDVRSKGRNHAVLSIENSYSKASKVNTGRLFERFYRVEDERSEKIGHGIGLALAKESAESLGGSLEAYTLENPARIGFRLTI